VVLIEPKDGYFYSCDKYTTEKDVFTLHEIKEEMFGCAHDVRKATVKEVYEDIIKPRSSYNG
jgi:hypothetical protein